MKQLELGNIGSLNTVIEHFRRHLKLSNSSNHKDHGHSAFTAASASTSTSKNGHQAESLIPRFRLKLTHYSRMIRPKSELKILFLMQKLDVSVRPM